MIIALLLINAFVVHYFFVDSSSSQAIANLNPFASNPGTDEAKEVVKPVEEPKKEEVVKPADEDKKEDEKEKEKPAGTDRVSYTRCPQGNG